MDSQITNDPLSAVRTLVVILDTGSLSAAARRVGLSPSAVSKQISRLEEHLGVRLLERTTRSVRATDAGLDLCQRTRPLFEAFAEATASARESCGEIRGRVRISATPALGRTLLLPALKTLADQHPDLVFDVILTGTRLDFIESELDLAVREGQLEDSSLVARRLGSSRVLLCASPDYVRGRPRIRSAEDLENHDLLLVPAASAALADLPTLRGRDGRRLQLRERFRVNDLFAVRELAESGAGIAALPDYVASSSLLSGALVRVLPRTELAEMPVHALYPSRRHLPRRVEVVLEALKVAAQANSLAK